jgi:hypothetical protein
MIYFWRHKSMQILLIAGILEAIPYFAFAAGKPAEYGRFALLPDLVLMLLAVRLAGELRRPPTWRLMFMLCMLLGPAAYGIAYWRGYLLDTRLDTSRMQLANQLAGAANGKNISVALTAEPAPYSAPPMNLFDWQWVLLPRGEAIRANSSYDLSISAIDSAPTPMSWANKEFVVYRGNRQ